MATIKQGGTTPWPEGKFGAILVDPPWHFQSWAPEKAGREVPYSTMSLDDIKALPVGSLASPDCALFMWMCWPQLEHALEVIRDWGFTYKTCAFSWIKADATQMELFHDAIEDPHMGLGYWTRANSEMCLLATKGNPRRQDAGVRQAIVEPRREHSRKPDCVYERIERLVPGPYLELFARTTRKGWTSWGNEVGKYEEVRHINPLPGQMRFGDLPSGTNGGEAQSK